MDIMDISCSGETMSEEKENKNPFDRLTAFASEAVEMVGDAANGAACVIGDAAAGVANTVGNAAVAVAGAAGDAADGVSEAVTGVLAPMAKQECAESQKPGIPDPMLDTRELKELDSLTERIKKLEEPDVLKKMGDAIGQIVPSQVKDALDGAANAVQSQKLYEDAMGVIAKGFLAVEEQAARFTIDEHAVLDEYRKTYPNLAINSLNELSLLRSYDVAKVAHDQKVQHLLVAFAEGAATGAPGFAGLPFNLVLSTFLYYRAVQSIAMLYGYDAKNNPDELMIAGEVFSYSLMPGEGRNDGLAGTVGKIMMLAEVTTVRQTVKKGWKAMIEQGGTTLLIAQIRSLAHGAARKALEKAGKKGLEVGAFRSVFEQVGRRLTQKAIGRAVPFVGAAIGAFFDAGQMSAVLEYADIFYHKRFIMEKEYRVELLTGEAQEMPVELA